MERPRFTNSSFRTTIRIKLASVRSYRSFRPVSPKSRNDSENSPIYIYIGLFYRCDLAYGWARPPAGLVAVKNVKITAPGERSTSVRREYRTAPIVQDPKDKRSIRADEKLLWKALKQKSPLSRLMKIRLLMLRHLNIWLVAGGAEF
jgi:hypothetical protein